MLIFLTDYVGLEFSMLHAKLYGNFQPVQETSLKGFLPYMGVAASLVTSILLINIYFLVPESLHIIFG